MNDELCPCGSGKPPNQCCGSILSGEQPAITAEQLMRSRYTAFVLGDVDYLRKSWHPDSCPLSIEHDSNIRWLGLKIRASDKGGADDDEGMVEFVARYKVAGRGHRIHERSRFVRLDDRWVYLDGEQH